MKGYLAFTKKEFSENVMNYRLLILCAVFLLFGMLSPLLAKYTPELLATFAPSMKILNSAPVALDSWEQFYKNISGVGFSAFIILFGNCLSNEYSKGTLVLMVTKGLPRSAVILSKFTAAATIMTVSYWLSFLLTYGYTAYLWKGAVLPHTIFAAFALWVIGFLYLSILMLGCVLFKQTFTSILFAGGIIAVLSLLGTLKQVASYSPFILTTKNTDLIDGVVSCSAFTVPMVVSVIMTVLLLFISIKLFNKKQL